MTDSVKEYVFFSLIDWSSGVQICDLDMFFTIDYLILNDSCDIQRSRVEILYGAVGIGAAWVLSVGAAWVLSVLQPDRLGKLRHKGALVR